MVLLVIRQYEGKSYRMFSEWLVEAYYLRTFLQLSHIPHFTTLQKFTERINGTLLEKIISSFIILTKIGQICHSKSAAQSFLQTLVDFLIFLPSMPFQVLRYWLFLADVLKIFDY